MNPFQHPTATATATGGRRLMPSSEYKRVLGGISEMSRWRHEKANVGPKPVKLNGRNFYFEDEVQAYLDELAASRPQPKEKSAATADNKEMPDGRTS
jgi:predicted DNA-binding transcriptional regulator AlpA